MKCSNLRKKHGACLKSEKVYEVHERRYVHTGRCPFDGDVQKCLDSFIEFSTNDRYERKDWGEFFAVMTLCLDTDKAIRNGTLRIEKIGSEKGDEG